MRGSVVGISAMEGFMKRLMLLSLLAGCLFAGMACAPYWYKKPVYFTVQESRLNWVQIFYQADEKAPRVRCDLKNNGVVTVLEGHSVTVGDDFNIEYDKPAFGDVRKYHYTMSAKMFRDSLQVLVDVGLMKEEAPGEDTPVYPKVMVRANINHHRIEKFTFDTALIGEIRTQLFQFKMSGMVQER